MKEIMAENFPNLGKEADILVQEAQRVPNKMNSKRLSLRHIRIKMAKVKEIVLKEARGKNNETPLGYEQISQQQLYRPERSSRISLKC